jgi:transposase
LDILSLVEHLFTLYSSLTMGKGLQLTEKEQGKVDVYLEQGMSFRGISKELNKSRGAIQLYAKDPASYGTNYKGKTSSKIDKRSKRRIIKMASTTGSSARAIMATVPVAVTLRTVQRVLNQAEFLHYVKRKHHPSLNHRHKVARLEYAKSHIDKPIEWDRVMWSDEKKFNLDGPDGLQYYWHDLRREDDSFFTRHSGGGGVMVWGAFSWSCKTQLAFLDGRQNSESYIETLSDYMIPAYHKIIDENPLFMQDGAAIHRSRATMNFLVEQNIELFNHPALSPDLNPIENVWGTLARQVYANGRQFMCVEDLKQVITVEWAKIEHEYLRTLVLSMPKRCRLVIEAKGGKTKY